MYGTAAPYLVGIGCTQADIRAARSPAATPSASCETVGGILKAG